jgi:uncharacterized protein YjdB
MKNTLRSFGFSALLAIIGFSFAACGDSGVSVGGSTVAVTGVTLNKLGTYISIGGYETLTAIVAPANATNNDVTWNSNNPAVATVTNGVVIGMSVGSAAITVTTVDGGKTATCAVTVIANSIAVTSVSLNKTSASINLGNYEILTATVSPANATNQNITWISSNTSVATVSSSGLVTTVSVGSATITATTVDGGYTASCTVTVTGSGGDYIAVTSVSLNKNSTSLSVNNTDTLIPTIEPSNATNKSVTWSSSNTAVATVSNGVVRGVSFGSATITVTTIDNHKTAICAVTIFADGGNTVPVTGVTLNKISTIIDLGNIEILAATVSPTNATNQNVTWGSSANGIATVSATGVITAVSVGSATITVTTVDGNKTADCAVTVTASISGGQTFTSIPRACSHNAKV